MELHENWLRVSFGAEKGTADFHYRWLRHNCDKELHPITRERLLCSSQLPDNITTRNARVEDNTLLIEWEPSGHKSAYPLKWLDAHAYARNRVDHPPPRDAEAISITTDNISETDIALLVAKVRKNGAVVLRRSKTVETPEDGSFLRFRFVCKR